MASTVTALPKERRETLPWRVRVSFTPPKCVPADGLLRRWVLIPKKARTVADLSAHLRKLVSRPAGDLQLSVDGFALPPQEPVQVLRDTDVVEVVWADGRLRNPGKRRKLEPPEAKGQPKKRTKSLAKNVLTPVAKNGVAKKDIKVLGGQGAASKALPVAAKAKDDSSSSSSSSSGSSDSSRDSSSESDSDSSSSGDSGNNAKGKGKAQPVGRTAGAAAAVVAAAAAAAASTPSVTRSGHIRFDDNGTPLRSNAATPQQAEGVAKASTQASGARGANGVSAGSDSSKHAMNGAGGAGRGRGNASAPFEAPAASALLSTSSPSSLERPAGRGRGVASHVNGSTPLLPPPGGARDAQKSSSKAHAGAAFQANGAVLGDRDTMRGPWSSAERSGAGRGGKQRRRARSYGEYKRPYEVIASIRSSLGAAAAVADSSGVAGAASDNAGTSAGSDAPLPAQGGGGTFQQQVQLPDWPQDLLPKVGDVISFQRLRLSEETWTPELGPRETAEVQQCENGDVVLVPERLELAAEQGAEAKGQAAEGEGSLAVPEAEDSRGERVLWRDLASVKLLRGPSMAEVTLRAEALRKWSELS